MTDKQVQKAATGSVAIQAQGSVTLNQGFSAQQMMEIIDAISTQVQKFSADAQTRIDHRLAEFKAAILDEFARDAGARPESFAEPDFQHALLSAQTSYARTDDVDLHRVLVDLVVQRSKQDKRSRLTLTLNDAIAKAASLTVEEFSVLGLAFFFQRTRNTGLGNLESVARYISKFVEPLLAYVPLEGSVYDYLESHGCLLQGSGILVRPSAMEIIKETYPGLVTRGLIEEDVESLLQENVQTLGALVKESDFDYNLRVLFPGDAEVLEHIGRSVGVPDLAANYINKAKANLPNDDELAAKLTQYEACVEKAVSIYNSTPIRNSRLTSVGMALAHAHLTKTAGLNADLAIWIR